jgi:tetratricopeptide (TPR) repeat protein
MSVRRLAPAAGAILVVLSADSARAQQHAHHDAGPAPTGIGRVAFPTTCTPKAQAQFEKGMVLLHSFWYEEAGKAFKAAAAVDTSCAMAHWGHAMSLFHQLWMAPDSAARREATADLSRARALRPRTARERAYIEALATYFEATPQPPADTVTPKQRRQAYKRAMASVAREFPDDDEASILYALALIAASPYGDTTFAAAKQADSILLPLARKRPTHPGVAHYIIHANDAPPLASLALDAARRYAQLAPAIPHAQHMPSHIFIQLGLWDEVIASNRHATESGAAYERQERMDGVWGHRLHTMDFLQYAYLQQGRDAEAAKLVDEVGRAVRTVPPDSEGLPYYQTLFRARQALERGAWQEAAEVTVPTAPDAGLTSSGAMARFARGLGAARSGDTARARRAVGGLDSVEQRLRQRQDSNTARFVSTQRTALSAWLALSSGDSARAGRLATEAAAQENDAVETPLIPAGELQGELLLALGRNSDALRAFELTLRRNPNRARSLFGAARAAALAGDTDTARRRYRDYLALMAHANGNRPELEMARRFAASR